MVKLSISDEQVFGELRMQLTELQSLLTPATERFAPVNDHLRHLLDRLSHFDPTVRIVVVGAPKSGKSLLINALMGMPVLPDDTTREIMVVPFDSDQPMVRRQAGKAIASGIASCREHFESEKTTWVEEFADRRLHARLPLIWGTHCYASKWVLVDTPSGTSAIEPTLSSVASRIHTPNVFVGDMMIYCVDVRLLGTPRELEALDCIEGDVAAPQSTVERLVRRTVFVLTHADAIVEVEHCIENIHAKQKPMVTSITEARTRFQQLFEQRFGTIVDVERIVPFSGRNALMAKRMLMSSEPPIGEVYDYSEAVFGSQFMQSIDNIEEAQLIRIVQRHAERDGLQQSGASVLRDAIRLADFHAVRHLMASTAAAGMECAEQLVVALRQAKPQISEQVEENQELLQTLLTELEWTVETSDAIEHFALEMHNEFANVVEAGFESFFAERVRELRYVMEHRELAWFRERQHCTVVEMVASLRKLEAFTEKYLTHREFLEARKRDAVEGQASWAFIDDNLDALLEAMEREKQEHLLHFCIRFAHHIKDELVIFLPQLAEQVAGVRALLKQRFLSLCETPLKQTERRMGAPFPLESALQLLDAVELVERNDRRTNNFLRDLPEHVSIAAVEVSKQWYVPTASDGAGDGATVGILTARSTTSSHAVTPTGAGGAIMEYFGSEIPAAPENSAIHNDDGVGTMMPSLQYVLEAWRLSCLTIHAHQLVTYNLPAMDENIAKLNEDILEYIRFYVDSLERGIQEQQQLVHAAEEDAKEVAAVFQRASPLIHRFAGTLAELDTQLAAHTIDSAMKVVREEDASHEGAT